MTPKTFDSSAIIARVKALDVVELLTEIPSTSWRESGADPWPAGTQGTVLELKPDRALIEISDGNGEMLDMIEVPLERAKVIWAAEDRPSPPALGDVTVRAATARSRRR